MAHIALCDDSADALRLAEMTLRRAGHTVSTFSDGQQLLAALPGLTPPPDLLISDVMMPGFTGFQLLQEIRKDPRWQHLAVLLLTALSGEEHLAQGFDLGVDDYLVKPYSLGELTIRVKGLLNRRQR